MSANLYALGAIALWASLAALGVALQHIPPFLLTGIALLIGSLLALPFVLRDPSLWKIGPGTLLMGVYGLFGFHFLLFISLRYAPAVEANLVNYLWPLLIVVMAPLFLQGLRLTTAHVVAALLGFAGAAIAMVGSRADGGATGGWYWGYVPALASAFIWSSYSLMTRRAPAFSTAAIGLFGLVSGVLSLLCHRWLESPTPLTAQDWCLLGLLGLGPLGTAFYLWDKALKLGDARQIGILSYLTPLGSTAMLMAVSGRALSWSIALAALMIVSAAVLGTRSTTTASNTP